MRDVGLATATAAECPGRAAHQGACGEAEPAPGRRPRAAVQQFGYLLWRVPRVGERLLGVLAELWSGQPRVLARRARQDVKVVLTGEGGFPPFMLEPIDFTGIYAARKQQESQGLVGKA